MRITWLGQGGFIFEHDHCRLAVDPYLSDSLATRGFERSFPPPLVPEALNADAIVCTHDHGDHFDPDSVLPAVASRPGTTVMGPASVVKHGAALGLAVRQLAPGNPPAIAGPFTLRAVAAHHSDPAAIGLIVEVAAQRLYLTGDTTCVDDLPAAALAFGPVDLLLICINGKLGNMTAEDAVKVTEIIRPRLAIPMHYGMFPVNTADPRSFLEPVRKLGIAARELPLGAPVPILPFRGIVPPVITPLDADETLNEAAFRTLLASLAAADLPALFLCGTAGLGPALTDAVYARVLDVAVDAVGSRIPLLAGVMEPSTGRAIARLRLAAAAGIRHAVVSVPYFFAPRSAAEFTTHFEACAAATLMTILPYNLPQYTHATIPTEVILDLWRRGLIGGIKESSGDAQYFADLCGGAATEGLPVFQGNRPEFAPLVVQGAAGAVPVPANAEPRLFARAWQAAAAGEPACVALQAQTDDCGTSLSKVLTSSPAR